MAESVEKPVRILLWILPRSISTALTKCLSFVDGMEIWFEALSFCGLAREQFLNKGDDVPMEYEGNEDKAQEVAKVCEDIVGFKIEPDRILFGSVRDAMEASKSKYLIAKESPVVFPDNRAREYIPRDFRHVFLIRNPYKLFISYRLANRTHQINVGLRTEDAPEDADAFDIVRDDPILKANTFFSSSNEIWKYVRANIEPDPIVINADDLLANPAVVLSKFCKETGLPYSDSLLNWDASPEIIKTWKSASDDYSVRKANPFYKTALTSSKFLPPKSAVSLESLSPDIKREAEKAMPYYLEMNEFKI